MMKKLEDIPEKNPFRVPENYFEDLNKRILSATSGSEIKPKKINAFSRFRTTLLVAASVAGLVLISYSAVKLLTTDKKTIRVTEVLNEVSPDSYVNDIDLSSLEENASSLVLSEEGSGVSKKDIIDYLVLDDIDLNDIYDQL